MENSSGGEIGISAKADLTITSSGGAVQVADAQGNGGGNVRSKGNKWVSWTNRTGATCRLEFVEFLEVDEGDNPGGGWPFVDPAPVDCNSVDVPAGETWRGRLRRGVDACIKYSVTVKLANPLTLDPIIIIEK
jgi:hypothetical protein